MKTHEELMKTQEELRSELIAKASGDEAFRTRLLSEPKAAIEEELGLVIPEGFRVEVHEDGADVGHLVLPPTGRLSDAELGAVAGGFGSGAGDAGTWVWLAS